MAVIPISFYPRLVPYLILCVTLFFSGCLKKKNLAPEGMVHIPAGEFIMGSNREDTEGKSTEFGMAKPLFLDEHPQRKVFLPSFYIELYEVTNSQYRKFV